MKIKDLTGVSVGMLKVEGVSHSDNGIVWDCLCSCGNRIKRKSAALSKAIKNGYKNTSCGCMVGNQSISKKTAKEKGEKTYIPESPCGSCGSSLRYVSGPCVNCLKILFEGNREDRLNALKRWGEENPEKIKRSIKKHREANKDKIRERARERNKTKENRLKRAAYQRIRKHRLRAGGDLSKSCVEEIYDEQKGLCNMCRVELIKSGRHIDHIVPISRGGKNTKSNCQLLCPTCNLRKGSKLMEEL